MCELIVASLNTNWYEQPQRMQRLEPLTILHVRCATWHMRAMATIDQGQLQAAGFQAFEDRNPRDTGRLHRHRIHLMRNEPVC